MTNVPRSSLILFLISFLSYKIEIIIVAPVCSIQCIVYKHQHRLFGGKGGVGRCMDKCLFMFCWLSNMITFVRRILVSLFVVRAVPGNISEVNLNFQVRHPSILAYGIFSR